MDDKKIEEMIRKLEAKKKQLEYDLGKSSNKFGLIVTPDMDVESLTREQLYLLHSLLHLFYASPEKAGLTKKEIESLHQKVKPKINHTRFDTLDDINA